MVPAFVSRSAGARSPGGRGEPVYGRPLGRQKTATGQPAAGNDEQYIEQYARNWTTLWTNILIGRAGGGEQDRMTNREGLQQSLRRAFQRNIPYDKLVFDLISATGVNRPGETGLQRIREFPVGQARRKRRPGHGQDLADFPRPASPVHPVPQPSVQRMEAKPVLGAERLLPADRAIRVCQNANATW